MLQNLKHFFHPDNTFSSTNSLTAIDLGGGKLSIVGTGANSQTVSKGGSSDGTVSKTSSSAEAVISARGVSPIIRKDNGLVDNDVAANVFTWGETADGASVGVVVPTRFGISASEDEREQFEGSNLDADNDGNKDSIEYDFTITRGNSGLSVDIGYEVKANATLTAADFDGNVLPFRKYSIWSNEISKTLTIKLNNDTEKEGKESFDVKLVDKYGTAQILNNLVSRTILDDDPTNPVLTSNSVGNIDVVAGNQSTTPISIEVDYFDKVKMQNFLLQQKIIQVLFFDGTTSDGKTFLFRIKKCFIKNFFYTNLDEAAYLEVLRLL